MFCIFVHNLPRLRTLNIDRSNERKWLYTKKARSRLKLAQTNMAANYADGIVPLANAPTQAESLLHCLEQAAGDISLHVNADMCFNQNEGVTLDGSSQKYVNNFTYFGSSVSSTENNIKMELANR